MLITIPKQSVGTRLTLSFLREFAIDGDGDEFIISNDSDVQGLWTFYYGRRPVRLSIYPDALQVL